MGDDLHECQRRLEELEVENAELRAASHAFGALAERLNQELEYERRVGLERRVALRPTPDRRRGSAGSTDA